MSLTYLGQLDCESCAQKILREPRVGCKTPYLHPCQSTFQAIVRHGKLLPREVASMIGVPTYRIADWLGGRDRVPYWACRLVSMELGVYWPLGPSLTEQGGGLLADFTWPKEIKEAYETAQNIAHDLPEDWEAENLEDEPEAIYTLKNGSSLKALETIPNVAYAINVDPQTMRDWWTKGYLPDGACFMLKGKRFIRTAVLKASGWFDSPLIRTSDAASMLGYSRGHMNKLLNDGEFPNHMLIRIGNEFRFKADYLVVGNHTLRNKG